MKCAKCHHTCKKCNSSTTGRNYTTNTDCLACNETRSLLNYDGFNPTRCICKPEYHWDFVEDLCLTIGYSQCEENEYRNENGHCLKCHNTCSTCVGPSARHCTSCKPQQHCIGETTSDSTSTDKTSDSTSTDKTSDKSVCSDVGAREADSNIFGRCGCLPGYYMTSHGIC